MTFNDELKDLINGHLHKLRSDAATKFVKENPHYPQQQRLLDGQKINRVAKELSAKYLAEVFRHVQALKTLVKDITEQTTICASYLIFGKVCHTWEAIFLLSTRGFNHESMELARSINEDLDLIKLFHKDKTGKYINEWFGGKIIDNKIAREAMHQFIVDGDIEILKDGSISPKEILSDIYRGLSQYTHCSYTSVLESVDQYNKDFDWKRFAGFHFSANNSHQLKSTMSSTLITLKMIYGELGDEKNFQEMDKLLLALDGPHDEEKLKDLISSIRKKKEL